MYKAKAKVRIVGLDGKDYNAGQELVVTPEQLSSLEAYLEDVVELEKPKEDKPAKASSKTKAKK
jgi:hypothetical protein